MKRKNVNHCKRCGEIVGMNKRYLNTYLICERCWWLWKKNLKHKEPLEFDDWLKSRSKPLNPWTPEGRSYGPHKQIGIFYYGI